MFQPHVHQTTRRVESEVCPGVSVVLKKMTEGRRLELRRLISEPNRRIREILREQSVVEKVSEEARDMVRWLELQDEFDGIMIETINPAWITWGVKQIEGLEADGKVLGVEDWGDWPSALFDEVLVSVKGEAELNGVERKNLGLPTISGELVDLTQRRSTVESVENRGGGAIETVNSTMPVR